MADSEMHLIEEASGSDIPPTAAGMVTETVITADASQIEAIAKSRGGKYEATDGVKLHIDLCVEVSLYFILGVEMSKESYASDIIGDSFSWDICSADNAKIGAVHIDNLNKVNAAWGAKANDLCTLEYKNFDEEDADSSTDDSSTDSKSNDSSAKSGSDSEDTSSNEIAHGEKLNIMQLKTIIDPGETTAIIIQQLPYGYEMSDIQFSSDDSDIVTVNGSGEITAVASGNALITIKTSDGKNMAYAAVTVTDSHNTSAA